MTSSVELEIDSVSELTEDEYSEKFSRPNYNRLLSRDRNKPDLSSDNESFVLDEDLERFLGYYKRDRPEHAGIPQRNVLPQDNHSFVPDEGPDRHPGYNNRPDTGPISPIYQEVPDRRVPRDNERFDGEPGRQPQKYNIRPDTGPIGTSYQEGKVRYVPREVTSLAPDKDRQPSYPRNPATVDIAPTDEGQPERKDYQRFEREQDLPHQLSPFERNFLQNPDDSPSTRKDATRLSVRFSEETPKSIPPENHEKPTNYLSKPGQPHKQTSPKFCAGLSRRWLWIIIIILVILLVIMTSLFIWKAASSKENAVITTAQPTLKPTASTAVHGCLSLSKPAISTLTESIRKELQEFKTYLKDAVDKNQTAVAVSANVVFRDEIVMEAAYGLMNKQEKTARSPTVKTIYPCASVTKALTALMLFKLVSDKKVRSLIDDTVPQYEPKFGVKNPFNSHVVTLWQLATHTSGLQREAPCYPGTDANLCPHSYDTMMNRLKNLTLLHGPGTVAQYSNLGFAILGQILFKSFATTEPTFGQWMEKNLLSQIGMNNATFSIGNNQKSEIPVGYLDDKSTQSVLSWGWLSPAGGMFASVDDLAKLQIELMSEKSSGRIMTYQMTQEFFKPNYMSPGGDLIGSPWTIISSGKGYFLREIMGHIYGYDTYIVMIPELRLGMNLHCTGCTGKLFNSRRARFLRILDAFLKELPQQSTKMLKMPSNPNFFIGRYNSSIPDISVMEVKLKKDPTQEKEFLVLAVNNAEIFYLDYISSNTFQIVINPHIDCTNKYILGVENDIVKFDQALTSGGLSPRFVMFGAEPTGRSYFYRQ